MFPILLVASESLRKHVTSCSQRCSCWWPSRQSDDPSPDNILLTLNYTYTVTYGPLASYVKFRVAHAPGMPGTFPPLSDPDMHHGTCVTHVPWCMSGSLTSGFLWSRWQGKRSRHSGCMRNPKYYVSGKRPMGCLRGGRKVTRGICAYQFNGHQRLWWEQGRRSDGFLCLYASSMIYPKIIYALVNFVTFIWIYVQNVCIGNVYIWYIYIYMNIRHWSKRWGITNLVQTAVLAYLQNRKMIWSIW